MTEPSKNDLERPLAPAIVYGLRGRCAACGDGQMFGRFLKAVAACASCGTAWDTHQADDLPAYAVILLLGHILVPLMIEVNSALSIPLGLQALIWPALAALLALALIQPVKGAVIALQWSKRMQGFR